MKYIISTLKTSFRFNISGTRKLLIDTKNPIAVSNEEFVILEKRLGNQIKVVKSTEVDTQKTTSTDKSSEENTEVEKDEAKNALDNSGTEKVSK